MSCSCLNPASQEEKDEVSASSCEGISVDQVLFPISKHRGEGRANDGACKPLQSFPGPGEGPDAARP